MSGDGEECGIDVRNMLNDSSYCRIVISQQSGWRKNRFLKGSATMAETPALDPASIMCPHCGRLFDYLEHGLIPRHDGVTWCPGGGQYPRDPAADARLLWNGQANPHLSKGCTE